MPAASRPIGRKENLVYLGLLVFVVAAYLGIRAIGDGLSAPPAAALPPATFPQVHVNEFLHVLLALTLVIACARALGAVFRWVKQPPVVGEMIAGILLGPSLLGHFAPHFAAYLLPQSIAPLLNVISQFGVILYMFLVGLELDLGSLGGQARATVTISHASIVAPFLLGTSLALFLYPRLSNSSVSFTAFSLFLGVSMSVTAFPVLARILTDRRIHKTRMGALTLACAAIDDVSAWCLLAFVVSVTQAHSTSALRTMLMAAVYVLGMLFVARPLVTRAIRWIDDKGRLTQGFLALVLLGILFSSLATESIGIHAIFGAFVLGAIIPHRSAVARELTNRLEDFVVVFLLPAFFAFTGLRTQIGLVNGWDAWLICGLIVLVASAGKFGGSLFAARLCGLGWRDSSALGVLMNTRGLMELIVLNIGLELHVISPSLFAMLVLMAIITTLATTPILHAITRHGSLEAEAAELEQVQRMSSSQTRAGVLIPASSSSAVEDLLELANPLTSAGAPPVRVLAINRASLSGAGPRMRDEEAFSLSRSPVLASALDAAWSLKMSITPEAIWTTDAADGIVRAASNAQVRWVLLDSRRSLFGRYPQQSVVHRVVEHPQMRSANVAIVLQRGILQSAKVSCFVCGPEDGAAAIEFASKLRNPRTGSLEIMTVEGCRSEWASLVIPDVADVQPVTIAPERILSGDLNGQIAVIGKDVFDRWRPELDRRNADRTIIVVRGASAVSETAAPAIRLQPAVAAG